MGQEKAEAKKGFGGIPVRSAGSEPAEGAAAAGAAFVGHGASRSSLVFSCPTVQVAGQFPITRTTMSELAITGMSDA
jgi:hypothetical protein